MNLNTFKSKYAIGDLVEFRETTRQDGKNLFGFVTSISFRKTDSVNYTADYDIEMVNTDTTCKGANESSIVRCFKEGST